MVYMSACGAPVPPAQDHTVMTESRGPRGCSFLLRVHRSPQAWLVPQVLNRFRSLWDPVIQPALGILMAGTLGVGALNFFRGDKADQQA
jgi:hypothetical protein